MDLVELIKCMRTLSEKDTRYPNGRGTYKTKSAGHVSSKKSRVKVYPTIGAALKATNPGAVFSTKGAARLYVTSRRTHGGTDTKSQVSGRIAKGFTPGSSTPGSDWDSIKGHAKRTKDKYGGGKAVKHKEKNKKEKILHKDKKVK